MSDLSRVCSVPVVPPGIPPAVPHIAALEDRAEQNNRPMWDRQRHMLRMLGHAVGAPPAGGFFEVQPGGGKTLVSALAAAALQSPRPLLIVPAALKAKALADIARTAVEFDLPPEYVADVHTAEATSTKGIPKGYGLIVIDEAHTFASGNSARVRHLESYLKADPGVRVVALSGTMGAKPCSALYILAWACLRNFSFLPLHIRTASQWGEVLDYGSRPAIEDVRQLGALIDLFGECGVRTPEAAVAAYRARRRCTPGVVAYDDVEVGASLNLSKWRPSVSKELEEALNVLRSKWELPGGDRLVDALEFQRHADTLAVGFFYRRTPVGSESDIDAWMSARLEWGRALRWLLAFDRKVGLESPARVVRAIEAGRPEIPVSVKCSWENWVAIRERVTFDREVVWVDRGIVKQAAERLLAYKRGLLWYSSVAVGEELARLGVPVYGGGTTEPPRSVKHAALLIRTHGTGKDLQAWDHNLVLESPRGAIMWDQMLARTHRAGQMSDSVSTEINAGTWASRAILFRALREAQHQEIAMGQQRLLYGTWL